MCALVACPPGKYRCDNNNCVFNTNVCDGFDHCGDGSDETKLSCKYNFNNLRYFFLVEVLNCDYVKLICILITANN